MSSPSYYLEFLGCRLNAAETEEMTRQCAGTGGCIVRDPSQANVIIINTCAVTAQAVQKSRRRIITLHNLQPEADIAVVGCGVTGEIDELKSLPFVRWVVPNPEKGRVVNLITGTEAIASPWEPGRWGHTRAFLAVQDGCDHHCTYCLTKVLRGPARSRPFEEVVKVAQSVASQGAKEIVLTGVSLGAFGHDLGIEGGLATLVRALLSDTDIKRLRLSSIEPWDVKTELLEQFRNPRLCRQLHLPLQSGSDTILRKMGRGLSTQAYAEIVSEARAISPDIAITTDVMVGFPGETNGHFGETLDFITSVKFSRLHVFPFSERAGTAAIHLPDHIPQKTRKTRAHCLRALSEKLSYAYRQKFVGKTEAVLYERSHEQGQWTGLTDTYIKVKTVSSENLYNCVIPTTIQTNASKNLVGLIG